MSTRHILLSRAAKAAGTNHMEAVSDSAFPPRPLNAMGRGNNPTGDHDKSNDIVPARDLRSLERHFKSMDEAHDRIRTQLLRTAPSHIT